LLSKLSSSAAVLELDRLFLGCSTTTAPCSADDVGRLKSILKELEPVKLLAACCFWEVAEALQVGMATGGRELFSAGAAAPEGQHLVPSERALRKSPKTSLHPPPTDFDTLGLLLVDAKSEHRLETGVEIDILRSKEEEFPTNGSDGFGCRGCCPSSSIVGCKSSTASTVA